MGTMLDVATLLIMALLSLQPSSARTVPTDCAMLKPVNPKFHSAMPIVKPDPKVNYALRIVTVPSCKT